jgi:hypothetical protein
MRGSEKCLLPVFDSEWPEIIVTHSAYLQLLPKDFNALTDPEKELTVLLPPDAALNKVLGGFQQKKLSAEDAALVLKHHILTGLYDAKELKEMVKKDPKMPVVTTLAEDMGELTVGLENGKITFTANNTVSVTEADISACSEMQIIHKINTIIIPDDMELDVEALPAGNPALLPGNAAAGPGPAAAVPDGVLDDSAAPGPAPSPAESETSSRSSGTSSAHGISGVAVGTVVAGFMAVAAL